MIAKNKKVWVALFLGLILPVLCVGCGRDGQKKRQDRDYNYKDSVGYFDTDTIASPEHEMLLQNKEKTIVYRVTYQPDITAKEAAEKFENDTEAERTQQTTWEQAMWEYNRFCYENEYAWRDENVYFHSVDRDIELWQYVMDDQKSKSMTETLFFDRADGAYLIEMIYPRKDVDAKMMLYYFAIHQQFQVDVDRLAKIREGLEWKDEVNEMGELVVTVTNNGDETVENLSCLINTDTPPKKMEDGTTQQGAGYDFTKMNVASGQTVTFSLTAEQMAEVIDYRIEVSAFYKATMWDMEKIDWDLQ